LRDQFHPLVGRDAQPSIMIFGMKEHPHPIVDVERSGTAFTMTIV
jgi:hypothetical protein